MFFFSNFPFAGSILFYGGSAEAGDDIPGIGQYEDFHTIDWQRDIARDRMRHRYIAKKIQDSVWDFIKVSECEKGKSNQFFMMKKYDCFHFRVRMMHGLDGYAFYL